MRDEVVNLAIEQLLDDTVEIPIGGSDETCSSPDTA